MSSAIPADVSISISDTDNPLDRPADKVPEAGGTIWTPDIADEHIMAPALLQAARLGDPSALAGLTQAEILTVTMTRNTVLHIAASLGHGVFIQQAACLAPTLLTLSNSDGDSPLHVAITARKPAVASLLINLAVHVSVQPGGRGWLSTVFRMTNKNGNTPLHEAVCSGQVDLVEELIRADAQPLTITNSHGYSVVFLAANSGLEGIVRLALDVMPGASLKGPRGHTALHAAVEARRLGISYALLERKPKLGREGQEIGHTPLHYASHMGTVDMVKLLLDFDPSTAYIKERIFGDTPLHRAAFAGHVHVIDVILHYCPDSCRVLSKNRWNILHEAVKNDNIKVIKYIISNPNLLVLLNEPDIFGNTPLHIAAMIGNSDVIRILLKDERIDKAAKNNGDASALSIFTSNVQPRPTIEWASAWIDKDIKMETKANYVNESLIKGIR